MDILDICLWTQDGKYRSAWLTSCENEVDLLDDNEGAESPIEIGMNYCYFCGKKLNEKHHPRFKG